MGGNGDDPPITLTKMVAERSYQNKAFTIPKPKYVKAIIITMKAIASNVSLFFSCFIVDPVLLVLKSMPSLAIASKVSKRERSEHGKSKAPLSGGFALRWRSLLTCEP